MGPANGSTSIDRLAGRGAGAHLQTIQRRVADRRLWLVYRRQAGPAVRQFERLVDPYGLVARPASGTLACVASGRLRVYRVADLLDVRLTDERFQRRSILIWPPSGQSGAPKRDPALAVRGHGPRFAGAGRRVPLTLEAGSATRLPPPRPTPGLADRHPAVRHL